MNKSAAETATAGTAPASPGTDGRTRRWSRHRQQRRLELLRLSRDAVAELGADASMAQIASHCRTSKSVFYRYFHDKHGLRRELAGFVVQRMGRRMAIAAEEAVSFEASVHTLVEQYLWQLENAPEVYRFVVTGIEAETENPVGRFATAVADLLIEAHHRHAPASRRLPPHLARYWASGVVGLVRGAGEAWIAPDPASEDGAHPADRPSLEDFIEVVTAWVVSGTAPPGSPSSP